MGAETIGPVPAAAAALSLTGLVVALYLLMTQPHGRVDQSVFIEAAVSGGGPAARVATAPDGRLLRANEAFERDFAGDAPSVLDRLEAQGADRSALAALCTQAASGSPGTATATLTAGGGKLRSVTIAASPLWGAAGLLVWSISEAAGGGRGLVGRTPATMARPSG